ncbi:hypothetical protein ABIB86_000475 [Bradyrhizobium sp. JR1.7]|uniref:hypothetical protein n=1 Tax=unclassified Bradyrhizobium TaxID=2631580 RepID=UPI0033913863
MSGPETETLAQAMERSHREYPARHVFEDSLRRFVTLWAPTPKEAHWHEDPERFRMDLMMLLRDAMQSQAETFSRGVDHYASQQIRAMSLRPLHVIMERKP